MTIPMSTNTTIAPCIQIHVGDITGKLRAYPGRDVRLGWSRVEWGKDARAKTWWCHVEPEDAAPRRPSAAPRCAALPG
jgi:hypothetical protein